MYPLLGTSNDLITLPPKFTYSAHFLLNARSNTGKEKASANNWPLLTTSLSLAMSKGSDLTSCPLWIPDGTRTIQRSGINFKGIHYFHPELNVLPVHESDGKTLRKYYVRYDPSDLRYLYILDDREGFNTYRTLYAKNNPSEPITLREVEAVRRDLQSRGNSSPLESLVMESILSRREYLNELASVNNDARKQLAYLNRNKDVNGRIRTKQEESSVEKIQEQKFEGNFVPALDNKLSREIRLQL